MLNTTLMRELTDVNKRAILSVMEVVAHGITGPVGHDAEEILRRCYDELEALVYSNGDKEA